MSHRGSKAASEHRAKLRKDRARRAAKKETTLLASYKKAHGALWGFYRDGSFWEQARPKDIISEIAAEFERNLGIRK
jgi:hypothetical protein